MNRFSYLIIDWYLKNKRDLPWRRTRDPYRIWVSEVILQQTRVEQGSAYYSRFLERFPDLEALASASEEEVIKTWQGLGYYSRARNMHEAARSVMSGNGGAFPSDYVEIRKMKGIGDYSAGAISSIAFGEPKPAIDGNVLRVVARFTGIHEPVKSSTAYNKTSEFLFREMDRNDPGTFNQAVMELGALVCKPRLPVCPDCPLNGHCFAYLNGLTGILPLVTPAKPPVVRFLNYFVIISKKESESYLWLKKRTDKGIWKNLYDFPSIESNKDLSVLEMAEMEEWVEIHGRKMVQISESISVPAYQLSHRELRARFHIIQANDYSHKIYKKVSLSELHNYPVPRLIERFLKILDNRPGIFSKFPD